MNLNSLSPKELEQVAQSLKAVAHPNRILIITLLSKHKRLSVGEICERTGFAQPLVSHHVLDMHAKGILALERDGRNAYYSLADSKSLRILRIATEIQPINNE
ncbi:MAG: metalloregulator ArsR/SmtB family transcription factor [Bacteroidales bacterium]